MLPPQINDVIKSGIAIGGAIVGLVVWGIRLEFQVGQKAGREELVRETQRIERTLSRVDERTFRTDSLIQKLVCRQYPADLGCDR